VLARVHYIDFRMGLGHVEAVFDCLGIYWIELEDYLEFKCA
jgi:hypothetical protein